MGSGDARPATNSADITDDRTDSVVELREVVAVLGSFPVLTGLSMSAHAGEIVLLQGPNGAGKTSVLRLCAGLVPVARGSATVCGIDVATNPADVGRHVGLIGHRNGLYLELTAAENVRFWASAVGASRTEADTAFEAAGLEPRLGDVAAKHLSAGQRRRTALACLIARRARLWLLDEPHAGLDANARDALDDTLRSAAQAGATVVLASHELERTRRLCDRVVDIRAGSAVREHRAPGTNGEEQ